MKTVLFVHQSAEMYGSDKVLLSLVDGLDRSRFRAIVLLPSDGPLRDELVALGIATHVVPIVKVSRASFSPKGLLQLPLQIRQSLKAISRLVRPEEVSVVHSNTLAVLSGALWARRYRIPHLWHVHEMIVHPRIARRLFPLFLRLWADRVVSNSIATEKLLLEVEPALNPRSETIWNGMERAAQPNPEAAAVFRQSIALQPGELLVVLMGRINRWKGQNLLVDAAIRLRAEGVTGVRYLIVGSPPEGQEHFLDALCEKISVSGMGEVVTVMGFQTDIWPIWDAADIAVVPSTEPEPFGMVALEAMAAEKPVIAAGHGGLLDIVVDGETGLLFKPGDVGDFARCLAKLFNDPELRRDMGAAACHRYQKTFSLGAYVSGFERVYSEMAEKTRSSRR